MPETRARLAKCFLAVFPGLKEEEVYAASPATVSDWDSVASLTLLTVIEEEFGVQVDVAELLEALSYDHLSVYLKKRIDSRKA